MFKNLKPFAYFILLLALYFSLCLAQRLGYVLWINIQNQPIPAGLFTSLLKGLVFDASVASFLFLPLALLFLVLPKAWFSSRWVKAPLVFWSLFPFFITAFSILTEAFFFNEFQARFNFIAVDYLVYTQEVFRNIWESYPVGKILTAFSLLLLMLSLGLSRLWRRIQFPETLVRNRIQILCLSTASLLLLSFLSEDRWLGQDGYWNRELEKNSIYSLFAAYHRNFIDFEEFYSSMEPSRAGHLAHEFLEEEVGEDFDHLEPSSEDETSVVRNIQNQGPQKTWNVILVIMESMSARFMQHYGKPNAITPNLDRLADNGLFFNHIYATGTRTVRGLEAIMLSLPPTPGQSILRRPKSDGIFNLGRIFTDKGYRTQFVYGGYSYFDNMREWFSSNGFEVIDRAKMPENEIHFANAWGVCDEDLFDQVLKQADSSGDKPFFQAVLTTSNHRPYTYPDGRIDIPSHTGREGAVKYTDYAIGRFVKMAEQKPWFKNTLLIFVADHNAAVAGGTDIPIQDYLIPMIFYNPQRIPIQHVNKLGSQMDLAPTLLGMLGFDYQSRFFGQNLFKAQAGRALLGTYQKVALMQPGQMTVLAPGFSIESQRLDGQGHILSTRILKAHSTENLSQEIQNTVAIYQTASRLFQAGQLKLDHHFSTQTNLRDF